MDDNMHICIRSFLTPLPFIHIIHYPWYVFQAAFDVCMDLISLMDGQFHKIIPFISSSLLL